ncbi:4-hydroxyproline epimerase [Mesorhizobium sp. M00.F.Ca.ET.151.01.1.1]|uniref:4-hydroxyproline epimerase n=1 Tax=unclassified Mesorhizobium TaxID=325217 RepID=UPI00109379A2|nr:MULTISPECIES: 4-hydroxyproline epimerase [unclassified Mesorhizobium]TGU90524.1 4-hydroxyproline epimerase [Mesorhizobium sp. M00.F.Ca.ET.151.01.1.1]TGV55938.1 4-hydroxyproline epimerase [bacterium M00.F.Ca.ET.141.01.1.1]TIU51466.1 MAG: 4-hydroxyproline epimerase [Mesorhizobium sp.]TGQ92984.1 4-hydroxyproline epimerase [Mesorhizobium sp. M8A.F.Ca.ET.208.01.1.1]TGT52885.1 4-hydroxyproline epimerase [Mesorhizobium sp. M8A.F.Ca.ET.167.01.1.1]
MAKKSFFCIDGHTCGNPVRLVAGGGPLLQGSTMMERRAHFLAEYDWIRTGLMFEPRGHDVMSGSILYPPTREDCDIAILFIETSGCLPMCGHGTIGTVTMAIEHGLIRPKTPGVLRLDTPAGLVIAEYKQVGEYVEEVRITNVPSFLHAEGLTVECPGLGEITVDVAYGGNFYAIVEPQANYRDMADYSAGDLIAWSPVVRQRLNEKYTFVHPENPGINRLSHMLWTGKPTVEGADARNAVFYGDKAIDRSPCGTGTSARMAQLHAKGKLKAGDAFVHESIIGSLFKGKVEKEVNLAGKQAIIPSIGGWARMTGLNTIFIDDRDPFAHGFVVK